MKEAATGLETFPRGFRMAFGVAVNSYLKRICELQPAYSPDNTPAMIERGELIRRNVRSSIDSMRHVLAPALGEFGSTFHTDASDGIGRKTELPWVRFCSEAMSPKPTEGFYSVIHFSTDGSAVHITVGCGSSRFFRGSSIVLPDKELDAQTAWARSVVLEKFGTLDPFRDPPSFGASRRLPRSFERATAFSKRVAYEDIDHTDFEDLLRHAAERLGAVYKAQATGRDVSPADQLESELAAIESPRKSKSRRQGFGLPAAAKRAVELQAMILARQWFEDKGYNVEDRSADEPYDLEVSDGSIALKIEVKGTTSDFADAIMMTRNEVNLHKLEQGRTGLVIVSSISLSQTGSDYTASGGNIIVDIGWDIHDWELEPLAFRLSKRV